ncbi:MAG: DUF3575 domain-containing protein [Muribaculaceae bacterium]|nr:DUF3575 domain-containing protein [Muribaculaceae bacterium]
MYFRILITSLLAVVSAFTVSAVNPADSVKVFFRQGYRYFDPDIRDNAEVMDAFITRVRAAVNAGDVEKILIYGYASPEGSANANDRLTRYRCDYVSEYIQRLTGVAPALISTFPEGVAWSELRRLVAIDPSVPDRDRVLNILDNTPLFVFDAEGHIIDGRKKQLMDLSGGRTYNWMLRNIFPELRNAVAISLYRSSSQTHPADRDSCRTQIIEEVNVTEISGDFEPTVCPEDSADSTIIEESVPSPALNDSGIAGDVVTAGGPTRQRFALKTNLLYDAALMPNLEFEWLINDRWSVSLEGDVAWWKLSDTKIYRLAMVSPEVRYHINPRAPWHGMYVGGFVGGGIYQLEKADKGYRGEGGMAGASIGYMWPISKNFSFDAEIGAGYMYTRYKKYIPQHGHKVYQLTKSLNYFGPLKVKFSIVWRFDVMKKHVKVNSTL